MLSIVNNNDRMTEWKLAYSMNISHYSIHICIWYVVGMWVVNAAAFAFFVIYLFIYVVWMAEVVIQLYFVCVHVSSYILMLLYVWIWFWMKGTAVWYVSVSSIQFLMIWQHVWSSKLYFSLNFHISISNSNYYSSS